MTRHIQVMDINPQCCRRFKSSIRRCEVARVSTTRSQDRSRLNAGLTQEELTRSLRRVRHSRRERNGRPVTLRPPWTVGRGKQRLVYFEEEPGRASGAAWCSGGLDPSTECVGVVLSSNARAKTQARLMRKARVRADSTRVRSTNETSLCIPIKKEKPLPCSGSRSPIA